MHHVQPRVTYGGFVALPGPGRYRIGVEIRPGQESTVQVEFAYEDDP